MIYQKNTTADTLRKMRTLFFITAITATLGACKKDKNTTAPEKKPTVQLNTSATLGSYLTDTLGNTLYYFSNDYNGQNNCTGGCAALWPPYYAGTLTEAALGAGLELADFGTTADGKQTTYKGWPLYYYAPKMGDTNVREKPGDIKGEAFNNVWFVAKPDYSIMLVNAQLVGNDGKKYKSDYTEGEGKTLYFSDGKGITLYAFTKDKANDNNYTDADFTKNVTWPIYETEKMVVPSILNKALFGSTTVYGKKQLTYNGWPLYYFGADGMQRGSNKGVSVPSPGVWPVVATDTKAAPVQ